MCVALAFVVAVVAAPPVTGAQSFRVRTFTFVDRSRTARLRDGETAARTLVTVVRIPAAPGRHPLVVFAHGFALMPGTYAELLDAWARAGYVVAAPAFPLERANAPGGPDESDLVNEPRDISFVVDRLLALDRAAHDPLTGAIDRSRIAVAGHSDGAVAALAAAYDPRFRDARFRAAIVLSGAMLGGMRSFSTKGPPLLAVQGTDDPINSPATTAGYFALAHRPKFLLWLLGASHRPPYTTEQPQLGIVELATIDFLGRYLRGEPLGPFVRAARRRGLTRLVADP